jgi:hypothetical protein
MCCGQKRSALRSNPIQRTAPPVPQTVSSHSMDPSRARVILPQSGMQSSSGIRYLGSSPLRVRGPVTGRQYEFSGSHPVHSIDPRDAALLLRTRFFGPA